MKCVAALLLSLAWGFAPQVASAQLTPTTTVLTVTPASPVFGNPAVLTATITSVSPGTATGTVSFYDAGTFLGTAPVTSGIATLTTSVLGAGHQLLSARYNGDSANSPSASGPVPVVVAAGVGGVFQTGALVPFETDPVTLAVGDLNGDGFIDLVVGDLQTNNVTVSLGNGDGTFQTGSAYTVGINAPSAVALADMNGDGKLDIVVTDQGGTNIAILNGNGDGTFQQAISVNVGASPRSVVIADFNGDGLPDIATTITSTTQSPTTNFTVLLNTGSETFAAPVNYTTSGGTKGLTTGDFNGDGIVDIAVADYTSNRNLLSIFLGIGDGTFQTPTELTVDSGPTDVITADFNGDGKADLATANSISGNITVLLGNGDGTFNTPVPYPVGNGPYTLVASDFNGDSILDLAVVNNTDGTVSILLGIGDGTFQANATIAVGASPRAVSAANLNSDNIVDLAVVNSSDNSVSILIGKQSSSTSLSVSPNPAGPGQPVLLTATVTPAIATGTVTFYDGTTPLATEPVSGGVATLTTTSLASGTHSLSAVYSGDANFITSTSNTVTETIGGIVTPTLTVAPPNPVLGQAVTLSVSLSPGSATGAVTFYDGAAVLGQSPVVSGTATFTTLLLAAGPHMLVARYDGDVNNLPVFSNIVPLTVSAVAAGGFGAPSSYSTGIGPTASVFGDFNGDGKPDVAVTNYVSGNVSILLGNGDGTFQPAVSYPAGTQPDAIAAGDLNGDGIQDLVITNYGSANVTVLLGVGDGTFTAGTSLTTGANPAGVVIADLNNDGIADVVVSETGTNNVSIFLGVGNGTFQAPAAISVGGGLKGIASADFNSDLKADLAVVGGAGVYVLLGNGDGTFAAPVLYAAGGGPIAVATADLGNGKLDLIVVNSLTNNVSILLGNGDGTFRPAMDFAVGIFPQSVAVGDFNGDGKLDLAVANEGDSTISRLIGNGDGTFQPAVAFPSGVTTGPVNVITAALNGTGQADLVVANYQTGNVSILLALSVSTTTLSASPNPDPADGPVTLTATVTPPTATGTVAFYSGTLSLGSAPVVGGQATIAENFAPGNVSLTAVYSGDSVYGPSTSPVIMDVIGLIPSGITVTLSAPAVTFGSNVTLTATLNQPTITGTVTFLDGTSVIGGAVVSNGIATLQTTQLPVGLQNITARFDGSSSFSSSVSGTASLTVTALQGYSLNSPANVSVGFPVSVVAADFNHDGKPDIAVATSGITVLLGNGDGTFQTFSNLDAGTGPSQVVTGDFNGDGNIDLAVADSASNTISILLGYGDGRFQPPLQYPAGSGPSSLTVSDFNGDGIADIAVADKTGNGISILEGIGDGTFFTPTSITVGTENTFISSGDFNGDGAPDIVVADFASNSVWVLLNNGDGTFGAPVQNSTGTGPVSLTVADFNADGKSDIVVANQGSSNVSVLLGAGNGTFAPAVSYNSGAGSQYVSSSDFNGDGILDLAVANESGAVSILLGNGDGSFRAPVAFPTGADPVSLAVASFTADGRAQVATANLAGNSVSVLTDGPAAVTVVQGTPQTADAESTFAAPFVVQTTAYGLPVVGVPVTFSAPATGASGIFAESGLTAVVTSTANGMATSPAFTANTFAGPYSVTASTGPGTFAMTTFSLANTVAGCSFTVGPPTLSFANNGGSGVITVTAASSCAWSAATASPWISIGSAGGAGTGSTTISVTPNSTGMARTGTVLIGGQTITIIENATAQIFADVPPSAYYFDAANTLYAKGITSGCSAAPLDFCPTESISRAQMAIFLVRAIFGGDNFNAPVTPFFTDVPPGSFGYQWIQELYQLGITTGCGDGKFCPNDPVLRSQMAIFLVRTRLGATAPFDYSPNAYFTDVPSDNYSFQWVQRIKQDQITSGCTATTYCPGNAVTRGDMAILLTRAAFNLLQPAGYPIISQISTPIVAPGQMATLTVTGVNTNWVQGTTSLMPIPGITFGPVTVTSPTSMTTQITVSSTATPQPYSVTAVTGLEEDVLPNGLMIQQP